MQILKLKQPPTLNEMLNKARTNKYSAATDKSRWTNLAAKQAIKQLEPIEACKVWIIPDFQYCTTASDPDNLFASLKYVMDGLTKAKIIPNDTVKVIQAPVVFTYSRATSKKDKILTLRIFDDILEWKHYTINLINEVN